MIQRLLQGGDAPIYLLHGDEALLTREAMAWLRHHVLQGIAEDFNLDRFDGRENPDLSRLVQSARTLPMMGPRRLVWVQNARPLFDLKSDALAPLLEYLAAPDPSTTLVLHANVKLKKNGVLYKRASKHGVAAEFVAPRERELPRWLQERARAAGRTLRPDAAALLAEAIGRDLGALADALERVMLFVTGDGPVELEHVEQTVAHTRTRTVWELVEAIGDRDTPKALARAHLLLGQGEHPLRLLPLVSRQFRQLLAGHAARAGGANTDQAAAAADVHGFRVRAFTRQLENYEIAEIVGALRRLAQADRALKGSKLPDALILESCVLDLCAGPGS